MKLKYIIFLFAFLLFVIFSCNQDTVSNPISPGQFFDLKSYFKKELINLKQVNSVIKTIDIDGKVERKTLNNINFEEELVLFVDSDINKISWLDKYEIDSFYNDRKLSEVVYQAKDEKMKTNQLRIFLSNQEVDSILILRKNSSITANLEQQLTYAPSIGYTIESHQKTSLSKPHSLKLKVLFLPND